MNRYMQLAIESALEGVRKNHGGPFGACITQNARVIAVAHNTVLRDRDCTCHAEINAIRAASKKLRCFDLSACELYSTAEPCPMCLAAVFWSRIRKIHIGVGRQVAARYGFDDARLHAEFRLPQHRRVMAIQTGVMREACQNLFAEWKSLHRDLY
ncbi:MAG: nucleoside deaminase [Verrucomicrobia bacterium]|nr:nucleoside deaminase [Verrucomicrobiota bacterium]